MKDRTTSFATPIWVYLLCAWPLALLSFIPHGGWIIGLVAFGVNLLTWKSPAPLYAKIIVNLLVGIVAVYFSLP